MNDGELGDKNKLFNKGSNGRFGELKINGKILSIVNSFLTGIFFLNFSNILNFMDLVLLKYLKNVVK